MIRPTLRQLIVLTVVVVGSGCAAKRPPAFITPSSNAAARLNAANEAVNSGCLDCLIAAYREYTALLPVPAVSVAATSGAIRAAALIDIRERELGLLEGDYGEVAQDLAASALTEGPLFSKLLDIVSGLRLGPEGIRPATDEQVAAMMRFASNRAEWTDSLREAVPQELLARYAWLAFACDPLNSRFIDLEEARALVGNLRETPLLMFGYLTSCDRRNGDGFAALLERDGRFLEANYLLGLAALGQRPRPDVDAADRYFRRAYEWRQDWPSLTLSIANLATATEDFDRAFQFYDRLLALRQDDPDALVGRVRALTYLGRYQDALEAVDALLTTGRNRGEARYWRAFNENELGRHEEAWGDIELARTLIANAEVAKLAGVVAYQRHELPTARRHLEEARRRNAADCETGFYYQLVLAEQREWSEMAAVGSATGTCFDQSDARLQEEIAALRAANGEPERVGRQIARREEQLATNGRLRSAAWFNVAVALLNLGRHSEARTFALKLVDDQRFGDRAREILSRLNGAP
jgi:tetratricopeptide (TPR) repeat protein